MTLAGFMDTDPPRDEPGVWHRCLMDEAGIVHAVARIDYADAVALGFDVHYARSGVYVAWCDDDQYFVERLTVEPLTCLLCLAGMPT